MLFKISWRNIWRNKKRSLIIVASVTIGISAGIFLMAFYNGMIEQRVQSAIQTEISHLQLHHPSFLRDYDIRYYIQNGPRALKQINSEPLVKKAAGRIIITGMIGSATGSSGVIINGVTPDTEDSLTGLSEKVREGNYFDRKKTNEILIGQKLLQKMNLKLNQKAILTFQDIQGSIVSAAFRIRGIFKTVNTPYDETNVFVRIGDIDELAGLTGQYNEIAVLLHSNAQLDEAENLLKERYPKTEIKNWKEISPEIGLTVSLTDQMLMVFMGIILLALAFGIINTMLMSILERTREIGMLLALGMNKLRVFTMILTETVLLVLAGCPGGILIALVATGITHQSGISLKKFSDTYASFGYSDMVYPEFSARYLILSMILVVFTAIISSLFPAWRALHLKPAEAMKN